MIKWQNKKGHAARGSQTKWQNLSVIATLIGKTKNLFDF